MNKKSLAVLLSQLKTFEKPNVSLEQYQTGSEIAADALWFAHMHKDIQGKIVADLGCGTGILGIGALVLGAKKVYFVDIDKEALKLAKENKEFMEKKFGQKFKAIFINKNIKDFKRKADVVIQNPPFGVKKTHNDKLFLIKAMETAPTICTFHKLSTKKFVERFVKENNYKISKMIKYTFPLVKTFWFHTKKTYYVDVGFWRLHRKA